MKLVGFVFFTLALMSFPASAPAQEEARIWTSASGAKIEATLNSVKGDLVVLNQTGGGQVRIRMNQLSRDDQIFARAQSTGASALSGAGTKEITVPMKLKELFGEELIDANKSRISPASLSGKKIGIYFSAHWCGPCRAFTPELVKFYNQLKADNKLFEIVFVSHDREEKEMMDYMKEMNMPWLALQYGDKHIDDLKARFNVAGIPTLVIIDDKGSVLSAAARGEVTAQGAAAFKAW